MGRSPPHLQTIDDNQNTGFLLPLIVIFALRLHHATARGSGGGGGKPPSAKHRRRPQNIDEDLSTFATVDRLVFASRLHCETADCAPSAKHGRRSERTSCLSHLFLQLRSSGGVGGAAAPPQSKIRTRSLLQPFDRSVLQCVCYSSKRREF